MNDPVPDRTALKTETGVSVWVSGGLVVALTKDMLFAKRFETQSGREKAVRSIEAGEPVKSAMGLLTKSISLEAVRSVCHVPAVNVLVVRGGRLKDPVRLDFSEGKTPTEIFAALHARCGDGAEIQSGKASVNDVPFDPKLGLTILFGLLGVGAVIFGALDKGPIGAGRARFLEQLGRTIGPVGAFLIGGLFLAIAIATTVSWWKNLPEKRFFQTQR
jgi:hypothetical protein